MATPPTLVLAQQSAWNVGTSPKTLTVTTQVGDVLVLTGIVADANITLAGLPTMTGTAETWTLQKSGGTGSVTCWVGVWTCICTAAQTTTISRTSSAQSVIWGMTLKQWRGSGGIGASVTNNSGASATACSQALTTTGANSAIDIAVGDWSAVDGTTRTWRTVDSVVLTEDFYFRDSAQYTVYSGRDVDSAAAGSKTLGLSLPAAMIWSLVAVEILGSGAAPAYPWQNLTPMPRYR